MNTTTLPEVIETKGGRFYIRLGFNGCNLPANNGNGYATPARALAAAKRCGYRLGMPPAWVPSIRKEG